MISASPLAATCSDKYKKEEMQLWKIAEGDTKSSHQLCDKKMTVSSWRPTQTNEKYLPFEASSYFLYPKLDLNLHLRQVVHLIQKSNSSEFCN